MNVPESTLFLTLSCIILILVSMAKLQLLLDNAHFAVMLSIV